MKAYGELQLTIASPAQVFVEPVTVDHIKGNLRVTSGDDDWLIMDHITAARREAEIAVGFDLVTKQWDLSLDILLDSEAIAAGIGPMRLNSPYGLGAGLEIPLRWPLQSVDLFQYTDSVGSTTQLTEGTDYLVDKRRAQVTPPWGHIWPFFTPQPSSAVLARFTSGLTADHPFWLDDGAVVRQAIRFFATTWYETRVAFGDRRGQIDEYPYSMTQLLQSVQRPRVH